MKKKILLIIATAATFNAAAQNTLKIYTSNPEAAFIAYINGEKQNSLPDSEDEYEINCSVAEIKLTFKSDTVSDIVKIVKFKNGVSKRTFEIVEKTYFGMKMSKISRQNIQEPDEKSNALEGKVYDIFKLEEK